MNVLAVRLGVAVPDGATLGTAGVAAGIVLATGAKARIEGPVGNAVRPSIRRFDRLTGYSG